MSYAQIALILIHADQLAATVGTILRESRELGIDPEPEWMTRLHKAYTAYLAVRMNDGKEADPVRTSQYNPDRFVERYDSLREAQERSDGLSRAGWSGLIEWEAVRRVWRLVMWKDYQRVEWDAPGRR